LAGELTGTYGCIVLHTESPPEQLASGRTPKSREYKKQRIFFAQLLLRVPVRDPNTTQFA